MVMETTAAERQQRITISVESLRLSLTVPAQEEAHYRRAEEELRLTTNIYRARYPNPSELPSIGYMAMAAIDIAYRNQRAILALSLRDLDKRLSALNESIEELYDEARAVLKAAELEP